jgi:hypothetical protein
MQQLKGGGTKKNANVTFCWNQGDVVTKEKAYPVNMPNSI